MPASGISHIVATLSQERCHGDTTSSNLRDIIMETLAIIGLIGNVVQFIDFSGKLIAKLTELYRSSDGALAENIDAETATNHLALLNNKLKDAATGTSDDALKSLCESCKFTTDKLLAALNKVKVNGKQDRWKSIRKALQSVWSKEEIRELEGRLARFRQELNLHLIMDLRCICILLGNNCANQTCYTGSKSRDLC